MDITRIAPVSLRARQQPTKSKALNVVCCETAIRLELGAKRNCQARAQNVADDPSATPPGGFDTMRTQNLWHPRSIHCTPWPRPGSLIP